MARKTAVARRLAALALVCAFGASLSGCALSIKPKAHGYSASAQSLLYSSDPGLGGIARLLKDSFRPAWQSAPRAIDVSGGGRLISIDECAATIRSNGTRKASRTALGTAYRADGLERDLLTISVFTPKPTDDDPIRAAIDAISIGTVSGAEELLPGALHAGAAVERVLRLYSRSTNAAGETEICSRYFFQLTQDGETRVLALSFLNAFSASDGWRLCLSPAECRAWAGSLSFNAAM